MGTADCFDTPAHKVKRNFARAGGYLRRNEFTKAAQAACSAFRLKGKCGPLFGQQKHELEFMCVEFCDAFSAHPGVIAFLDSIKIRTRPFVTYKPGTEAQIITKLDIVCERMVAKEREQREQQHNKLLTRKIDWLRKGQQCLDNGELPRGRSYLKRVADEFEYEPGLLADLAERLAAKELFTEAAEMLARAMELHPKDHKAYALAVRCAMELQEWRRAEEVYMEAIKQFGGHPRTYLNLSKLYVQWRKRDKAFEYAKRALDADPALEEAREIMNSSG